MARRNISPYDMTVGVRHNVRPKGYGRSRPVVTLDLPGPDGLYSFGPQEAKVLARALTRFAKVAEGQ